MKIDFADDIRQSFVITRNEIKKFFSGKKILLFGALILLVIALMTAIPYLANSPYENSATVAAIFAMFIYIIVELAAVLFTSTSLVSEFEERTALILFTKPIRKWSIFIGKLVASLVVVIAFSAIYYAYTAAFSMVATGGVETNLLRSFGVCVVGIFGISGVAMLMSSIAKKGSTASIMTLVVVMLLISLVASLLQTFASIDTWWSLDSCMSMILTSVGNTTPASEIWRACGVLAVWGVVCNAIAFLIFRKRDF